MTEKFRAERNRTLTVSESEMNESVNRLIDNLKYWQKDEFGEYFSFSFKTE